MGEIFPEGTTIDDIRAHFVRLKRRGNDTAEEVIETIDQMHDPKDVEVEPEVRAVFRRRLAAVLGESQDDR